VIDGAKALATAVRKVFGDTGFIQRCTLHKCRNVRDHLPKDQQAWGDRKLAAAFNHDDPAKGERACRDLAGQLAARWPDAASPREASRTCSPSGGSVSAAGSPRASRTRSCSTGMRCWTSRMSGRTDAPPPSGRDSKLDARDDLGPKS